MHCSLPDDMLAVTFMHGDKASKVFYIWHADVIKACYDWMQLGRVPLKTVTRSNV